MALILLLRCICKWFHWSKQFPFYWQKFFIENFVRLAFELDSVTYAHDELNSRKEEQMEQKKTTENSK